MLVNFIAFREKNNEALCQCTTYFQSICYTVFNFIFELTSCPLPCVMSLIFHAWFETIHGFHFKKNAMTQMRMVLGLPHYPILQGDAWSRNVCWFDCWVHFLVQGLVEFLFAIELNIKMYPKIYYFVSLYCHLGTLAN